MKTYFELVPGERTSAANLTLTCPICHKTHHNIGNTLIALPIVPDKPDRRYFYIESIDKKDVCPCLLENFLTTTFKSKLPMPMLELFFDEELRN